MPDRPVALVTGAGSGIGRACALLLAGRGYRLALTGRREAPLQKTGALVDAAASASPGAESEGADEAWATFPADIAAPEQARGLVRRVVDRMGRLDALVNNAGWSPATPMADLTPDAVAAIFAVNAIGPTLLTIEAVRTMRDAPPASRPGRIVNVSSMASDDPFPGLTVYGGAKAALNTITRGLTTELGDDPAARVFCVAPGAVETDLLRSIVSRDDLPTEACLSPEAVATVIVDCATGRRDAEAGTTIWLPSP